jgi:uncharacterized protein (DUF4415 family)
MSSDDTTIKAVLTRDGRMLVERPDGGFRTVDARTDWQRDDALTDWQRDDALTEEIERNAGEEMAELGIDADWPDHARLVFPRRETRITMRVDPEVLGFFKAQGKATRAGCRRSSAPTSTPTEGRREG